MMRIRSPINPRRIRRLPARFSWIDQRLVRDQWLAHCDHETWALYSFLVIVADAQGLSFYGDERLCQCLSLGKQRLQRARRWLVHIGLIAYRSPLYQVLSLEDAHDYL